MLWPRCLNLDFWRFSQGLPCRTPLQTFSNQAFFSKTAQSVLSPWTFFIPKMSRWPNENKTQDLPCRVCKRVYFSFWHLTQPKTMRSGVGSSWWEVRSRPDWGRVADEDDTKGTKNCKEKGMKGSPPKFHPWKPTEPQKKTFFGQRKGASSVIGFLNYLPREFCHVRIQQEPIGTFVWWNLWVYLSNRVVLI